MTPRTSTRGQAQWSLHHLQEKKSARRRPGEESLMGRACLFPVSCTLTRNRRRCQPRSPARIRPEQPMVPEDCEQALSEWLGYVPSSVSMIDRRRGLFPERQPGPVPKPRRRVRRAGYGRSPSGCSRRTRSGDGPGVGLRWATIGSTGPSQAAPFAGLSWSPGQHRVHTVVPAPVWGACRVVDHPSPTVASAFRVVKMTPDTDGIGAFTEELRQAEERRGAAGANRVPGSPRKGSAPRRERSGGCPAKARRGEQESNPSRKQKKATGQVSGLDDLTSTRRPGMHRDPSGGNRGRMPRLPPKSPVLLVNFL